MKKQVVLNVVVNGRFFTSVMKKKDQVLDSLWKIKCLKLYYEHAHTVKFHLANLMDVTKSLYFLFLIFSVLDASIVCVLYVEQTLDEKHIHIFAM